MDTDTRQTAHFWFDPLCPWAWLASRWLLEVTQVRPVDIQWHVMSLSVLNEGGDIPEEWQEAMRLGWIPIRTVVAAERDHGSDVVLPLYTAMGTRFHLDGRKDFEGVSREAVAEVGLPESLVDLALTDADDAVVRASHAAAIELVGNDVGTPVVATVGADGVLHGIFGPIVTPAPRGEAAGRLWDATAILLTTPGLYEMKRTREVGPIFD